jgi:AraC-like DNA-binding protein
MIRFGVWSTWLLIGSLHGLVVAVLLLAARRNRSANRFLAALMLAVVAMITPYTIGYAGVYDAWPWMSFAPFYWQLAFGPLLYFHVRCLGEPALPRRWWLHFVPGLLQGLYYTAAFAQPMPTKMAWNEDWHVPYVLPAMDAAVLVSLVCYWWLAHRRYRRYQRWLEANSGRYQDLRLSWVRGFLWAVAATGIVHLGFFATDAAVAPLDYFDYFPFYLVLTLLVYYLGTEGWRHAELVLPAMSDTPGPAPDAAPAESTSETTDEATDEAAADKQATPASADAPERDWRALGQDWAARTAAAGWWREPDLDLATLARRLGTNTHYLSRALNEGLGQSFSAFVNGLRVEAACRSLDRACDGDVLGIALEVGFGSKASFNRAFRLHTGTTPTDYRRSRRRNP